MSESNRRIHTAAGWGWGGIIQLSRVVVCTGSKTALFFNFWLYAYIRYLPAFRSF